MPALSSFDYAVLRIVPRVERGEFLNAGIILFCLERRFLEAKVQLDEARLRALWPDVDIELVKQHLESFPKKSRGDADASQIALLSQRDRFRWLVAPRSTKKQESPVHTVLCDSPEAAMERLFQQMVIVD